MDVSKYVIESIVHEVNGRVDPIARVAYFDRDTETGNARLVLYTEGDAYGRTVAVGSPRECWQWLRGCIVALELA